MLNISKSLNAAQVQSYHKQDYASETQSYYREGTEVKGEWHGKLAASLGLGAEVAPMEFSRLAEGQDPRTGEQMVQHRQAQEYTNSDGTTTKAVEHRAGWDATFSAPKSVSLTALVGGDERVIEAHRAAVSMALDELERYTQARIGGNNPAETTGKFIAAKFEHDTARPVDGYAAPQLHTHAVIFNVTERADGSTRALQPQSFFESQQFATAVYQSALTHQLRNFGYEIEPGRSGAPEIKGYSAEYLDASSPRSQQIKDQMEKAGYSGPEAAQIAAHATREKKQALTKEEVLAAHKEMATEYGNQPAQVIAETRERARMQERDPQGPNKAKEAVTFAKNSLYEREAVADERALLTQALRRSVGEATYSQVRAEFETRREAGDFRSVQAGKYDSGRKFTTPEMIAAERANIRHMSEGKDVAAPMLSPEKAEAQAMSRELYNDSQKAAIREVLTSTDRIHGLQGLAGSGKTSTLQTIREGAELGGYKVEGFAPTSKAAGQLREAGIDATTLQSFLARGANHPSTNPASRHLYMLDESSLASTKQMRAFLDKLNPDDRVLVIGDTRQHQGVEAGRPFQQMQEAGLQTSLLDKIMRQKDPELLKAVQHLANNETEKGVAMLAEQGRVTEIKSGTERVAAIAKDYADKPENTIIVSPDNRSRQSINEAVRAEMLDRGQLGEDGREFQTLTHRSDMTGAERTWAARYEAGNILQYTTGSKEQVIERDSFATVREVDVRANTLTVEKEDGTSVTYDPRRLRGVNVFREASREVATGDRIQFVALNKELGVANRDLGTVLGLEDGKMTVKMDGKEDRTITFDPSEFRSFDHGYAVTSHSSQGLTASRVLANIDIDSSRSLINTRLAYVSISRASDDARIYTNNAETLGKRLAKDITKTAAVDFSNNMPREFNGSDQMLEAIQAFRANNPQKAIEILQDQGRIYEYANLDHRLAAVAVDYSAHPDRTIVIVPDRADRHELTQLIRAELQTKGAIDAEVQSLSILVEQYLGNPELAASYKPDDEIHYKKGSHEYGIANHSTATVKEVDAANNLLTIETREGDVTAYNPALLKQQTLQSTVYREEERELGVGDRIRFTATHREDEIRNGAFAFIERIGEDNSLTVRLDGGKLLELNSEQARHLEHGYVVDSAKFLVSDRVILTGEYSQLAEQQSALTSISSKVKDFVIYTSDCTNSLRCETPILLEAASGFEGPSLEPISSIPELSAPEVEIAGFGIAL